MRKLKIYIETTLFNFFVDEDRGFAHDSTVTLFKEIAAGKYEAFTSSAVIEELAEASAKKFEKMFSLIDEYKITVLRVDEETEKLADIYVSENVIPIKHRTDGVHIAVAAVNNLDLIISMNFEHIVKRKTKFATASINAINGYRAVEIFNPMEVIENVNN